jgi:hypothetical protein
MGERGRAPLGIPPEPNASGEPHDVLAAEEFAMPAPEATRGDRPLVLPPEPNASGEPHDVLAAEEFAMPAPPPHVSFAQPSIVPGTRDDVTAVVEPSGVALVRLARWLRDRLRRS